MNIAKKWIFVDDEGNFYMYDPQKQRVRHKKINFNDQKKDTLEIE